MSLDEKLANRIRDALAPREAVTERRMFGGIAFMVGGNMAVGVIGEDLMVRLDPADAQRALAEPHTRPMDFTGRPAKSRSSSAPRGESGLSGAFVNPWLAKGARLMSRLPE